MKDYLDQLEETANDRLKEIRKAQLAGAPVICHSGRFIPEELIRACGAFTFFRLSGSSLESADRIEEYISSGVSAFTKGNVSQVLSNHDPLIKDVRLIITAFTDNHMSRMSELLEYRGYPIQKVGVPIDWEKAIAFQYYVKRLRETITAVSEITGKPMDEAVAREYLDVRNRRNELLREVNQFRKGDAVTVGALDVIRLHRLAHVLKRREDLVYFEEFIRRMRESSARFSPDAPRLLLVGHGIAMDDDMVLHLLDQSGCPVVAEFFDEGMQTCDTAIDLEGDLLINYARSEYHDTVPMSTFQPSWRVRFEHIQSLIRDYGIDGVIWYQIKNDEIYDMEYFCLNRWLEELGMPVVRLETDYDYSKQKVSALKKKLDRFLKSAKKHTSIRKQNGGKQL